MYKCIFYFVYNHIVFQATIHDMNLRSQKPLIVEQAVNLALDHKATHREMTSVLISDMYSKTLSAEEIRKGFDIVLNNLSDLTIDTPDASTVSNAQCFTMKGQQCFAL